MATNGDERLEAQISALKERGAPPPANVHPRELDNFAMRAQATAVACDELAAYCTSFAAHLRKASADFQGNVAQMMGRLK